VRKIISIVLTLGVILGLTAFAAPVAAAPCVCPTTMAPTDVVDLAGPPNFCAGGTSDYMIGGVTAFQIPITLIEGRDWISVDFPVGTDLSSVLFGDVFIDSSPLTAASQLKVSGAHLEAQIPIALIGTFAALTTHDIEVDGVINTATPGTYCLYVDYVEDCAGGGCAAVQFACVAYTVAPAVKEIGCHFDFDTAYPGIAEDFIPPFLAGAAPIGFDFILRDENGGCSDPCTTPSGFWFEVTKCPVGETITFAFTGAVGSPFTLTNADVVAGTKFALPWTVWPPADVITACTIGFSSPGDYEICFYVQCPAGGCPTCGGPTIVTTCCLGAKAYQYLDSYKIDIDEKWDLISLPLFPYDTSIAGVLGAMDHIDQLVSVWYFGQCEDPDPDEGVWHTAAYNAATDTFSGDLTTIVAGKAYWIRTLHLGETGYVAYGVPNNGLWVFGTHAIMPDPTGVDMGYFDVCDGWNMVGYKPQWSGGTPVLTDTDDVYLWNFNQVLGGVHYGLIYDWNSLPLPGDWTSWAPTTLTMTPGFGYWIPFDGDDQIYPAA
jgi:hypothetical protein